MAQPMIDTLEVADALQRSGMERGQAEAFARSLGSELGEHVAGHKDLELGFAGMRTHVDERLQFAELRSEITGEIKALHGKFNTLGIVLASGIAFLGVVVSLDRFV